MFSFINNLMQIFVKTQIFDVRVSNSSVLVNQSCDDIKPIHNTSEDLLTTSETYNTSISKTINSSDAKKFVKQMITWINETISEKIELNTPQNESISYYFNICVHFLRNHWILISFTVIFLFVVKEINDFSKRFMNFDIPLEYLYDSERNTRHSYKSIAEKSNDSKQLVASEKTKNLFTKSDKTLIANTTSDNNNCKQQNKTSLTYLSTDGLILQTEKVLKAMLTRKTSPSNLKRISNNYRHSDELQAIRVNRFKRRTSKRKAKSVHWDETVTHYSQESSASDLYFLAFIAMTTFIIYKINVK